MILLLDVDGVLVEHRAYRAGIRLTLRFFCQRLGLPEVQPSDFEIDVFESQSITVEWETSAIVVAALLLDRLRASPPDARLPADLWAALDALPPLARAPGPPPDLAAVARRVGAATRQGELPSLAALRLLRADVAQGTAPTAALPLLEHLLGNVYAVDTSPAVQVFQSYVLGDEQYARYYDATPRVHSGCLLETLDRPVLEPALRDLLLERQAAGSIYPVIYTARPSLAPVEAGPFQRGFTPEAEIARDLVGLAGVPVMGLGKMDWAARDTGRSGLVLVKPSPVHPLAAIGAALTGREAAAVQAALGLERGEPAAYPLTESAGHVVHVFEDSPSSLRATAQAVAWLNERGLGVGLVRHGIAVPTSPKHAALAAAADHVHADVNSALRAALGL